MVLSYLPVSLEQTGRTLGSRPTKGSPRGFAAAVRPKARMAMRVVKEGFMVLMWSEDGFGEFGMLVFGFGLVGFSILVGREVVDGKNVNAKEMSF